MEQGAGEEAYTMEIKFSSLKDACKKLPPKMGDLLRDAAKNYRDHGSKDMGRVFDEYAEIVTEIQNKLPKKRS